MNQYNFYSELEARTGVQSVPGQIDILTTGYNVVGLITEINHGTIWGNYLIGCLKTWNKRDAPLLQLPNAGLGLIGELHEYHETPTLDEFGDILYYRVIFRYLVGDTTEIYSTKTIDSFNWFDVIKSISNVAKKVVYHDKMHDAKIRNEYDNAFAMFDAFLWSEMLYVHRLQSFEEAFQFNINKLTNRHKGSFNPNYDSSTTS